MTATTAIDERAERIRDERLDHRDRILARALEWWTYVPREEMSDPESSRYALWVACDNYAASRASWEPIIEVALDLHEGNRLAHCKLPPLSELSDACRSYAAELERAALAEAAAIAPASSEPDDEEVAAPKDCVAAWQLMVLLAEPEDYNPKQANEWARFACRRARIFQPIGAVRVGETIYIRKSHLTSFARNVYVDGKITPRISEFLRRLGSQSEGNSLDANTNNNEEMGNSQTGDSAETAEAPKRRGRPKGSKNRPKPKAPSKPVELKLRTPTRGRPPVGAVSARELCPGAGLYCEGADDAFGIVTGVEQLDESGTVLVRSIWVKPDTGETHKVEGRKVWDHPEAGQFGLVSRR